MQQVWAGVDIGKAHHHAAVIDSEGRRLLSRRVANDEAVLLELIAEVSALADAVTWVIDVRTGGAALLMTLLLANDQKVFYISGHMVNRAAGDYRGEGKTDAREACSGPPRPSRSPAPRSHRLITAPDGIRANVAMAADRCGFVLVVGGSSVGKTRCLFEAIRALLPDRWLVHPDPDLAAQLGEFSSGRHGGLVAR